MQYDTYLHQAIHPIFNSDIYVSTALLVFQVIFFYDLLGGDFERYLVILVIIHLIFQVEVPDIYNKVFPIWCGEDAVPMDFGHA